MSAWRGRRRAVLPVPVPQSRRYGEFAGVPGACGQRSLRHCEGELERVQSLVPGLDTVLRGGFLRGGLYMIQGLPGTGKTILANQTTWRLGRVP